MTGNKILAHKDAIRQRQIIATNISKLWGLRAVVIFALENIFSGRSQEFS